MATLTDRLDFVIGAKSAGPLEEHFGIRTVNDLVRYYPRKEHWDTLTGALFIASATLGAAAAHGSPADKAAVTAYARNLALAFQIVDELIDATGEAAEAGKDVGKDLGKTTFVSLSGVDGAKALACDLIAASQEALDGFGSRAQPLRDLARYVVTRRK